MSFCLWVWTATRELTCRSVYGCGAPHGNWPVVLFMGVEPHGNWPVVLFMGVERHTDNWPVVLYMGVERHTGTDMSFCIWVWSATRTTNLSFCIWVWSATRELTCRSVYGCGAPHGNWHVVLYMGVERHTGTDLSFCIWVWSATRELICRSVYWCGAPYEKPQMDILISWLSSERWITSRVSLHVAKALLQCHRSRKLLKSYTVMQPPPPQDRIPRLRTIYFPN